MSIRALGKPLGNALALPRTVDVVLGPNDVFKNKSHFEDTFLVKTGVSALSLNTLNLCFSTHGTALIQADQRTGTNTSFFRAFELEEPFNISTFTGVSKILVSVSGSASFPGFVYQGKRNIHGARFPGTGIFRMYEDNGGSYGNLGLINRRSGFAYVTNPPVPTMGYLDDDNLIAHYGNIIRKFPSSLPYATTGIGQTTSGSSPQITAEWTTGGATFPEVSVSISLTPIARKGDYIVAVTPIFSLNRGFTIALLKFEYLPFSYFRYTIEYSHTIGGGATSFTLLNSILSTALIEDDGIRLFTCLNSTTITERFFPSPAGHKLL